jgi:hypothetical protein
MVLATHHFWGHITWCSRGVCTILSGPNLRNSHISDSYIAVALHDQVLRLDVPVNDPLIVHVLKSKNQAAEHELSFFFIKSSTFADVVA